MDKPGIVSESIRPLETTLELSVWWLLSKQITCSELSALLLQHCTPPLLPSNTHISGLLL